MPPRTVPLGITPRAFAILSKLRAGEPRTQQQLANAFEIHRNNMVGLIDEMEAAGWVKRHRSRQERRAFEIHLTPGGEALVQAVNAILPAIDDNLGQGPSPAERRTLASLLGRVAGELGLTPGVHPNLAKRTRTRAGIRP